MKTLAALALVIGLGDDPEPKSVTFEIPAKAELGVPTPFTIRERHITGSWTNLCFGEWMLSFEVRFAECESKVFSRFLLPGASLHGDESLDPEGKPTLFFDFVAAGKWTISPVEIYRAPYRRYASREIEVSGAAKELVLAIETSKGVAIAAFDPQIAPAACLWVAKLARDHRYDELEIGRVIHGAIVQFGSSDIGDGPLFEEGSLKGRFTIPLDASTGKHVRGALTLWRPGVAGEDMKKPECKTNGNGSFMVCLDDEPWMDGRYCVFGHVVSGIEVLDEIGKAPLVPAANGELSKPKEAARVISVKLVPMPEKPK